MTEFDSLKKKISEDPQSFIVILGAGASVPAGLPTWKQLKNILCECLYDTFDLDEADRQNNSINNATNLWYSFSRIKAALGSLRYEKEIARALDVSDKQIPQLYKQLCELNIAGIINFNVDKLAINCKRQN